MLKYILKILKKVLNKIKKILICNFLRIKYLKKKIYISIRVEFIGARIEGQNKLNFGVSILNSQIGFGTYIAKNTKLNDSFIGKYCSIGPNVKLIVGRHPLSPFVSTHPVFYSTMKQNGSSYVNENKFSEFELTKNGFNVEIGNDVWIGSDVRIFQGLIIGDGAIIAAGSIVTKNIPSYEIWGGIPAKKIKNRFSEEQKNRLLELKWWNFKEEKLKEIVDEFQNVELFLKNLLAKDEK